MEAKHTPGPWEAVRTHAANGGFEIQSEDDPLQLVASVMAGPSGMNEVIIADVRLIAAAPELLEVCEAAYNELFNAGLHGSALMRDRLRAAIAKAKGEKEQS